MLVYYMIVLSLNQSLGLSAWQIEQKGGQVRYEVIIKK